MTGNERGLFSVALSPFGLGCATIALIAASARAFAGLPEEVSAVLRRNAACVSPIQIEWTEERYPTIPEADFFAQRGVPPDAHYFKPTRNQMLLSGSRQYLRTDAGPSWVSERSYDGTALFLRYGAGEFFAYDIGKLRRERGARRIDDGRYLQVAGFYLNMTPDTFDRPVESHLLRLASDGFDLKVIAAATARKLLTVRCAKGDLLHEFSLDANVGYGVVGHKFQRGDRPVWVVANSDFRQIRGSFYLPMVSTCERYEVEGQRLATGQVFVRENLAVTSVQDKAPAPQVFTLHPAPGSLVFDSRPKEAFQVSKWDGAIRHAD